MKLTGHDLKLLCQCAISAAYQAGHLIATKAPDTKKTIGKEGGSSLASQVLTETDLECEALILEALRPSCRLYDLALLSEEQQDDHSRLNKDYFWCIDPLDGTLPFVESARGYSVAIALVSRAGEAVIGVVYDPTSQILYHAIAGKGSYRNSRPWEINSRANKEKPLHFIIDRSFEQHPWFPLVLEEMEQVAESMDCRGIKTTSEGGAAMNACWVLEQAPACYFKFPKPEKGGGSLWDYAATSSLFTELGAFCGDIYGNPLALNRPGSTFLNHKGVLYTSDHYLADQIIMLYARLHSYAKEISR